MGESDRKCLPKRRSAFPVPLSTSSANEITKLICSCLTKGLTLQKQRQESYLLRMKKLTSHHEHLNRINDQNVVDMEPGMSIIKRQKPINR